MDESKSNMSHSSNFVLEKFGLDDIDDGEFDGDGVSIAEKSDMCRG